MNASALSLVPCESQPWIATVFAGLPEGLMEKHTHRAFADAAFLREESDCHGRG